MQYSDAAGWILKLGLYYQVFLGLITVSMHWCSAKCADAAKIVVHILFLFYKVWPRLSNSYLSTSKLISKYRDTIQLKTFSINHIFNEYMPLSGTIWYARTWSYPKSKAFI